MYRTKKRCGFIKSDMLDKEQNYTKEQKNPFYGIWEQLYYYNHNSKATGADTSEVNKCWRERHDR